MAEDKSPDVILCWMVTASEGDTQPPESEVLFDIGDQRDVMRARLAGLQSGSAAPRLFVGLGKDVWGVSGCLRCSGGLQIFRGLCQLDSLEDGEAFLDLGAPLGCSEEKEVLLLVKQDVFSAFLCRAWARESACASVRRLLNEGSICPLSQEGPVHLSSDEEMAHHYLELLLGRGAKDKCPLAEKYLQGVARDMQLSQQPYFQSSLQGRFGVKSEDSVLSILQMFDKTGSSVPRNVREDLALGVAVKVLELVHVMGLEL